MPPAPSPPPSPPPYALELTVPPYVGADNAAHAARLCVQQGGSLASIQGAAQNQLALATMLRYKRDRATFGAMEAVQCTGGPCKDNWAWDDGAAWYYTNWAAGMPDGRGREQCSEMWKTGEWNDVPCDQGPRAYICQVPVPPPGFTFACSAGVVARLGRSATCRYHVSSLGPRHKAEVTWQVAEARCRDIKQFGHGAQLAEPRTADQVQFLASALRMHGAESLWIGLRRVGSSSGSSNSNFQWESGATLAGDEARWAATEPNGASGDCVEMWEDGTWNDRACDIGKQLACERVVSSESDSEEEDEDEPEMSDDDD